MLIGAFAGFVLWAILFVSLILLLAVSRRRIRNYVVTAIWCGLFLFSFVLAGLTYGAVIDLLVWMFS